MHEIQYRFIFAAAPMMGLLLFVLHVMGYFCALGAHSMERRQRTENWVTIRYRI